MFIYLTSGTADFMEKLLKKYKDQQMIVLHGSGNSVLLHETDRKTVFATPRKFEVIDQVNALEQRGYFVFNHIPVSDEGRPLFEKRFSNMGSIVSQEPGLIAYRLLRPIKSETYIVLTQWSGPHSFETWKNSKTYNDLINLGTTPGVKTQNIFHAASYITTYSGKLIEEKK